MLPNSLRTAVRRFPRASYQIARLPAARPPLPAVAAPSCGRWSSSGASASAALVRIELTADSPTASLVLDRPPANSFSLELLQEAREALASISADPALRGVYVTSSNPRIFSAGLDLAELVDPDPKRLHLFWTNFQLFMAEMYQTPMATVACIEGHAPAGGCILGLTCDERVMASGRIGLNETVLGLAPPWWICDLLCRVVGEAKGEQMLQRGTLLDPTGAAAIGLIDTAVDAPAELMPAAENAMRSMLAIPDPARQMVKAMRRGLIGDGMRERVDADADFFVACITNPGVQHTITTYVNSLKK